MVGVGERFACANAHLNRDEAAVKMGHPGFGGGGEKLGVEDWVVGGEQQVLRCAKDDN